MKFGSLFTYAEMIAARGLAILGQLGAAIITARALGPEDRGRFFYIITLGVLAAQIGMLGLQASNGYLVARDRTLLPAILSNTIWVVIVSGLSASIVVVGVDHFLAARQSDGYVLMVPWLCSANLAFTCFSNLAVAVDRPRLFNVLTAMNAVALLAAVGLGAVFKATIDAFLIATLCSTLALALISWIALSEPRELRWRFDAALFRRGVSLGLRAHLATMMAFLFSRLGVIVLRTQGGYEDVGYWSVAIQITDAVLVLPGTIGVLLYPKWARAATHDRWQGLKRTLPVVAALMLVTCLLAGVLAGPVIGLIFGVEFLPAVTLTFFLLPSAFFFSLISITSPFLTTFGVPRLQLLGWAIGCVLFALSATWMVSRSGVAGVAWAQSASALFICVWMLAVTWRFKPAPTSTQESRDHRRSSC